MPYALGPMGLGKGLPTLSKHCQDIKMSFGTPLVAVTVPTLVGTCTYTLNLHCRHMTLLCASAIKCT